MAMRIYLTMRIDADIRIIRHMSDIARYMRRIFRIGIRMAIPSINTRGGGSTAQLSFGWDRY